MSIIHCLYTTEWLRHYKVVTTTTQKGKRRWAEAIYYFWGGGQNDFGSGLAVRRYDCIPVS